MMLCPVCKTPSKTQTGVLEIVSAISVSLTPDGAMKKESALLLDEYLSCNNCTDTDCDTEDCVPWHWESSGTDRRLVLDYIGASTPIPDAK